MVKIAFYTPQVDCRGSCVALYDYAHYNETILGNNSIIITSRNSNNESDAMYKFSKRFQIFFTKDNLDEILLSENCDILYCIKYGKKDDILSKSVKTVVHCVFDLSEPHGDVYAAVSETLAKKFNHSLFVPHMIGMTPGDPENNWRKMFKIPENATVFGRHGGMDTFDLRFVMSAIIRTVNKREDIYFIFLNTPKFVIHPRVLFLDKIVNVSEKKRFIYTCDAMIHAQSLGETFGLSIGEFSVCNRPIITYSGKVWNDAYRTILGNKAIYYNDENSLLKVFDTFKKEDYANRDMNCYRAFNPEDVMKQFKNVFID